MERRGLLPPVLDVTPAAAAWLNPTMDDDSTLDVDNLDDEANDPTNTATPTIEMDGDGGENTTTDDITNTGLSLRPIRCTRRCRWFCFCFVFVLFCLIVVFHCCLPSIQDDVREFLATFG